MTRSTVLGWVILLSLSGCQAAGISVQQSSAEPVDQLTLQLPPLEAFELDDVVEEYVAFTELTRGKLTGAGIVVDPASKTAPVLAGNVIEFDPGNQFLRWLVGFGVGEGRLKVEWTLKDRTGAVLGRCRVSGWVSGGLFGGSYHDVLDDASDLLPGFLKRRFRPSKQRARPRRRIN